MMMKMMMMMIIPGLGNVLDQSSNIKNSSGHGNSQLSNLIDVDDGDDDGGDGDSNDDSYLKIVMKVVSDKKNDVIN